MRKWTKQKVLEEALKFETRFEFRMSSLLAYRAACRHKWLDEVCAHMSKKSIRVKRNTWTKLRVYQESLKYETRGEFQKHSGRAYNAAWDKGWFDKACLHMTHKSRMLSQSDAVKRAQDRGLKLLSRYIGTNYKHCFECCSSNIFETRFSSIFNIDYRCSLCKSNL